MNVHHHRIRTGLLAGTARDRHRPGRRRQRRSRSATASSGPGVTQTTTTVTGSPINDTIDCGGIDRRQDDHRPRRQRHDHRHGLRRHDQRRRRQRHDHRRHRRRRARRRPGHRHDLRQRRQRHARRLLQRRKPGQPRRRRQHRHLSGPGAGSGHPRQLREHARAADARSGLGHIDGRPALHGQRRPVHRPLAGGLQLPVRRHADQEAAARRGRPHLHGGRWDVPQRDVAAVHLRPAVTRSDRARPERAQNTGSKGPLTERPLRRPVPARR